MIKILFAFLIYSLIFSGCTSQSNLPIYPITGSEFTDIWKQYDTYAKENNKVQLDFISTSKALDILQNSFVFHSKTTVKVD